MTRNNFKNRIENDIALNESCVWELVDRKQFNYSDGRSTERYLKNIFSEAHDLSSNSYELERWIRDWPSEYHLTRKRTQLLRGFYFDKLKKALEVGCGCGAITRFLGETFDDVVAIDGSIARAGLARLRTKGMENVSILCAPFQEIKFKDRFDIIFCIGTFEYSNVFVDAADPYDFILQYFHDVLTPDGVLVIAIENQFGLKYFSSSREDHTDVMFDGLEGYPRYPNKAKTFGYDEINARLSKYFNNINFYFPYPDYKIPCCILSERFFYEVKAGELVGNFQPRDYMGDRKSLFDEKLVLLELDKNNKLPFFSNSFLIVAEKQKISSIKFNNLGLIYSGDRIEKLQTVTRFVEHENGSVWVKKELLMGHDKIEAGMLTLQSSESRWNDGLSLHAKIMKRVKEHDITLGELFSPCQIWLRTLKSLASREGDRLLLDGKYVDCIWRNSYIHNGECIFIDSEWVWREKIDINVIVIRSIYLFLDDVWPMTDLSPALKMNSTRFLISKVSESLGIVTNKNDYREFVKLESEIAQIVFGLNLIRASFHIRFTLWNKSVFLSLRNIKRRMKKIFRKSHRIIGYFGR